MEVADASFIAVVMQMRKAKPKHNISVLLLIILAGIVTIDPCLWRLRIFLQALAYAQEPRSRTGFFGAGAHACLGRPLSIEVWRAMTEQLSRVSLRAHIFSYTARTSDYVFTCPEELEVILFQ